MYDYMEGKKWMIFQEHNFLKTKTMYVSFWLLLESY